MGRIGQDPGGGERSRSGQQAPRPQPRSRSGGLGDDHPDGLRTIHLVERRPRDHTRPSSLPAMTLRRGRLRAWVRLPALSRLKSDSAAAQSRRRTLQCPLLPSIRRTVKTFTLGRRPLPPRPTHRSRLKIRIARLGVNTKQVRSPQARPGVDTRASPTHHTRRFASPSANFRAASRW